MAEGRYAGANKSILADTPNTLVVGLSLGLAKLLQDHAIVKAVIASVVRIRAQIIITVATTLPDRLRSWEQTCVDAGSVL